MKKAIKSIISDEKGNLSSKRICGILCTLVLCTNLFANKYLPQSEEVSKLLIECITALAFGCLGLSTVDKFSVKKKEEN